MEFVEPHGAFYFFFRVDGLVGESGPITGHEFCLRLLQEHGVALVPGGAFGDDRWVRLSYAASDREIDRALDRMLPFMTSLGRGTG